MGAMLALQARQSDVLLRLLCARSGRLALAYLVFVGGCASRPAFFPWDRSAATALPDATAAAATLATESTPLAAQPQLALAGQAVAVSAGYDPNAAPVLGLIEELPAHYRSPTFNAASLPSVPSGRVPATLVSHMQVAAPPELLPAPPATAAAPPAPPAQAPARAVPVPEIVVAQPFQPPNQPLGPPGGQGPGNERWLRLPAAPGGQDNVQISSSSDLVSLTARDAPLNTVLALIAEQHGLNIVTAADVTEQLSVKITDARLEDALDAILATNGYTWTRRNNIIIISKISGDKKASPATQGRTVQVVSLNYMAATDADKVVQGLLSPVGQSFITATAPADHRRTHEQLVVEDLPEYLHRIGQYLCQADTAPRQVQIEAHVLQVSLKDNFRHGVNFKEILKMGHTDVSVSTVGLASSAAPASMIRLQGGDLDTLLEALKSITDAKTLASPKVTVLNNQEAHMQVGGKIGYLLSTTTQTSTLQSVNFLDVGVILTVLPSITADGQVLIKVAPQVSTGRINPTTNLPESETTEVKTQVLLADGEAIVIGGLIKETDNDSRSKVPFLGDLWLVGWLFQKREILRERNEIIITLVPRIVPEIPGCRVLNPEDVEQAQTPLLYGALESVDRSRFEPKFPCYTQRPRDRQDYAPPPPMIPAQQYPPAYPAIQSQEVIEYPIVTQPGNMPNFNGNPPLEMALPGDIQPIREP
jgi:hypothetical protein